MEQTFMTIHSMSNPNPPAPNAIWFSMNRVICQGVLESNDSSQISRPRRTFFLPPSQYSTFWAISQKRFGGDPLLITSTPTRCPSPAPFTAEESFSTRPLFCTMLESCHATACGSAVSAASPSCTMFSSHAPASIGAENAVRVRN
jgi:hypothetical protein